MSGRRESSGFNSQSGGDYNWSDVLTGSGFDQFRLRFSDLSLTPSSTAITRASVPEPWTNDNFDSYSARTSSASHQPGYWLSDDTPSIPGWTSVSFSKPTYQYPRSLVSSEPTQMDTLSPDAYQLDDANICPPQPGDDYKGAVAELTESMIVTLPSSKRSTIDETLMPHHQAEDLHRPPEGMAVIDRSRHGKTIDSRVQISSQCNIGISNTSASLIFNPYPHALAEDDLRDPPTSPLRSDGLPVDEYGYPAQQREGSWDMCETNGSPYSNLESFTFTQEPDTYM
ncbi:hypothetical protein B0H66DRAFT_68916 [Apodospora peruviana]|uniref:Uncharacterized protein n=1 Tax=Apodospora peruviana TaxID=516989 RepID=A0AAE0IT84_9PEZI|nr:hypothetical protein B0H66DRAFT_68916 [Apodospora peruviana]